MTIPQIDYADFQNRLVAALRTAWTEVRSQRPNETFYLYGIETDSDAVVLTPFCNTLEQFSCESQDRGRDAESDLARWSVDQDAALYGAGSQHTAELEAQVNQFVQLDEPEGAADARRDKLMVVFEQALAHLDREGFFGRKKARAGVLVMLEIIDADEKEWKFMTKVMKRLNPRRSYAPFFAALKKQKKEIARQERQKRKRHKPIMKLAKDFLRRQGRSFDRCDHASQCRQITPFLLDIMDEPVAAKEMWQVCFMAKDEPEGRLHGRGVLMVLVNPDSGKCVIAP